ncbi:hypothetical protein VTI28DRAFT_6939 [Corynascus sepedonium]
MHRPQQSSIRSFFQPRRQPEYSAPPSTAPPQNNSVATQVAAPPPPPPPPPSQPENPNQTTANPVTIPITLPPNGVPILPSPPSIPSGAKIVPLTEQYVPALRRINSLLLPVPYPDSFYARALDPLASGLFSRAILWQDSDADTPKVIGGLICRLEPNPFLDGHGQLLTHPCIPTHSQKPSNIPLNTPYHAIYIQSLALLSPYRSLGLAAAALEHIIASASLLPDAGSNIDARTVYAHVWSENDEGLKWYEARGFAREGSEPVKGYYFKLRPDSAWIVRRHIGPAAAVAAAAGKPALQTGEDTTCARSNTRAAPPAVSAPQSQLSGSVLAAAVNLPPINSRGPSPPHATVPPHATTVVASPSPAPSTTSAASSSTSISYQSTRPQMEWNDLPPDMVNGGGSNGTSSKHVLLSPNDVNSRAASGKSTSGSRSSSAARKKRERAYPSAAFGA